MLAASTTAGKDGLLRSAHATPPITSRRRSRRWPDRRRNTPLFLEPGGLGGGAPFGGLAPDEFARFIGRETAKWSAALAAAASLSMTARGVPAGATKPNQTLVSKSGRPDSAMVGRLGAMCGRLAEPEASPLIVPAETWGISVEATPSMIATRPAMRSVTAGGLPG